MTYKEVANRLVELMYVKKSHRWIDVSLRNMYGDFLRRVEERFTSSAGTVSLLQNFNQLNEPEQFTADFFEKFPQAGKQLISEEDCDYFLMLAARPGQKPVPFVPVLDERFEFFFKKDSLWQSEDLESVVDEDVQRTCILHGPVASQYTSKVDEPIGDILNSIHEGHIARLIKEEYAGDESKIPVVEYFGGKKPESVSATSVNVTDGNQVVYEIDSELPNKQEWLDLLAGPELNWLQAFISTDRIVQGSKHVSNPLHDILTPAKHSKVTIDKKTKKLTAFENIKGDLLPVVEIELVKPNTIQLSLIEHRTADANPVALPFCTNTILLMGLLQSWKSWKIETKELKNFTGNCGLDLLCHILTISMLKKLSWEMKLPFQAKLLVSSPMPSVTSVTHLLIDLVRLL